MFNDRLMHIVCSLNSLLKLINIINRIGSHITWFIFLDQSLISLRPHLFNLISSCVQTSDEKKIELHRFCSNSITEQQKIYKYLDQSIAFAMFTRCSSLLSLRRSFSKNSTSNCLRHLWNKYCKFMWWLLERR